MLHNFNNIANVWTHMRHTILAFHSFNIRIPIEYVLQTSIRVTLFLIHFVEY